MSERAPFKVGDMVTTDFDPADERVHRMVTKVESVSVRQSQSGWRVSADGGHECEACGRRASRPIGGVDSSWFKKVKP